ncbi:MAG: DUF5317 domain-containing protein [Clostridia bacterium]|nr:DUF5317 domain-containing protein [Clostridia bacterium]
MIFAWALLVSVVVGLIRGGRIDRFSEVQLRSYGLILLGFAGRIFLHWAGYSGLAWVQPWAAWIHVVSYVFLLYALALNLQLPWFRLVFLGTLANFVVIALNGARMPVSRHALQATLQADQIPFLQGAGDYMHTLLTSSTRLWWLGDWLFVPPPFPRPTTFSIGDVLVAVGLFLFVQRVMVGSETRTWSVGRAG